MVQRWKYWFFKKALPHKFCDDVIKYALSQQIKLGGTKEIDANKKLSKKQIKDLYQYRDSNVVWLNDRWIYDAIVPFVRTANKNANWNFEFDDAESIQFTIYKKGQFYNWHMDGFEDPYDMPDDLHKHGKVRKLSVTVALSDHKEYKGGDFYFIIDNSKNPLKPKQMKAKEIKEKGSIIVFPSYEFHKVAPIIKGTRCSLVIWFLGKPFK